MSCDKKQKMKIKFGTILISDVINLIGRHCNAIDLINLCISFGWNVQHTIGTNKIVVKDYMTTISSNIDQYKLLLSMFYPITHDDVLMFHIQEQNIDILKFINANSRTYYKRDHICEAILTDNVSLFETIYRQPQKDDRKYFSFAISMGRTNIARGFLVNLAVAKNVSNFLCDIICGPPELRDDLMERVGVRYTGSQFWLVASQDNLGNMESFSIIDIDFDKVLSKNLNAAKYIVDNNIVDDFYYKLSRFNIRMGSQLKYNKTMSVDILMQYCPNYIDLIKWSASLNKRWGEHVQFMNIISEHDPSLLPLVYDDIIPELKNLIKNTELNPTFHTNDLYVENGNAHRYLFEHGFKVVWLKKSDAIDIDNYLLWRLDRINNSEVYAMEWLLNVGAFETFKRIFARNHSEQCNIDAFFCLANVSTMEFLWKMGYTIHDYGLVINTKIHLSDVDGLELIKNVCANKLDLTLINISRTLSNMRIEDISPSTMTWIVENLNISHIEKSKILVAAINKKYTHWIHHFICHSNSHTLKLILNNKSVIKELISIDNDELIDSFNLNDEFYNKKLNMKYGSYITLLKEKARINYLMPVAMNYYYQEYDPEPFWR